MKNSQRGSTLIAVMIMAVVIGGMCAALTVLTVSTHRAASQSFDLQKAASATESALSYYTLQLELDADYFTKNPPPHAALPVGATTFQLLGATAGKTANEWQLDISGFSDQMDYRLLAVLGNVALEIPGGLVLSGTGSPWDNVLSMNGTCDFGSYDPTIGTGTINPNGTVWANGSMDLKGKAQITGDAIASGWIAGKASAVTGLRDELAPELPIHDFQSYAAPIAADSIATNDNGTLGGIFGTDWSPIVGPDNYGDLSLSGGSYVLPTGTYRFRDVSLQSGAKLVIDTSAGPVTLVCAGSDFDVDSGSVVLIDAGATQNGLVTVLESGASFTVQSGSVFGQEVGNPDAAGYSQLLSTGGSGDITVQGSAQLFARVAAASRKVLVGGGSSFLGSAIVLEVSMLGSGPKFLIDESTLGTTMGVSTGFEVLARWRGDVAP